MSQGDPTRARQGATADQRDARTGVVVIAVPEYSVVILEKDEDFDALMLRFLQTGLQLFIDPLFDLRGDLIKGDTMFRR
ncbi:hypothetical protein NC77_18665 [Janthinobacterium lividum]|uniref:hypothetical protein n=1 Tax=Janthinobacterium lividum TaxID=29581 RepID=UPI0005389972|nr:hypothetical protein NC77_18665 [Janthinobacterium lividum]